MRHDAAALLIVLAAQLACAAPGPAQALALLRSPDGRVQVALRLPRPDSDDVPTWSASFRDTPLLDGCRLGLSREGAGELLRGARLLSVCDAAANLRVPVLFGRADHAMDRYREQRVALRSADGTRLDVVFRCYDDAVAFRCEVPEQKGLDLLRISDEGTTFRLSGDPLAYVQYLEGHRTSHEHRVTTARRADLETGRLIDLPVTFAWGDTAFASITEAALRRYAGMCLRVTEDGALCCDLDPRPDGAKVVGPLPLVTPWRVVLIGDRPGALLESNTVYCLNDPPAIGDTAWIRPGKMTWPWWNNYLFEAERTDPILSLAMSRRYVDFCAANGIAYHAIVADERDQPWYHQSKPGLFPGPDTDATRVRDDLDLGAHRAYAEQKGVGLWTWVHHGAVRGRVEAVFAAFERLGWDGVMVDFLDRDDQDTVEFAEEVLAAAARHHVLVHFHGMYKPTGLSRTFPNLMNHEGALNLEYLKWTDACTPEHDLLMAFTRLVAGPMDYHLGGFRAVRRQDFVPRNVAPNVLGTRGHQLGLYVCFDNPNPMVADYPAAYRDQPGFDFVREVPTWWDETRVLDAEIGRLLVTARRRGSVWYVGGIGAAKARDLELPLAFLGAGAFAARVWRDLDGDDPNGLGIADLEVRAQDTLKVRVAIDGGFVARFESTGEQR